MSIVENIGSLSRTFYHVTLTDNLSEIMTHGLVPSVGDRSKKLGEPASVFLFPDENSATDAVANWLGDQFDEDVRLALLKIVLPDGIQAYRNEDIDWEYWVTDPIPASCIHIIDDNF